MNLSNFSAVFSILFMTLGAIAQKDNKNYLIELLIQIELEEHCNEKMKDSIYLFQDSILIFQEALDSTGEIILKNKADGSRWILPEHTYKIEVSSASGSIAHISPDVFNTYNLNANTRIIRNLKRMNICQGPIRSPIFSFNKNSFKLESVNSEDLYFLELFFCEYPNGKVELTGFRSENEAINIDKKRALEVVKYYVDQGISKEHFIVFNKGIASHNLGDNVQQGVLDCAERNESILGNRVVTLKIVSLND